jgi:phosphate transport system substrate-binding protein
MNAFRLLLAGALAITLATPVAAAEKDIVINGSTTVLPVMQKVSEAFMAANPGVHISLSGGGSGNGIKALNDGLCTIAMSSRDMKAKEQEQGKAKGIVPVRFTIAKDALVPVVHPSNTVKDLSVQQLRDIFTGKITNWKEVGGKDEVIVVISRDSSSGTFETWAELIMNKEKVMPAALLQASNGAVTQAVGKNKKAIGYIGFGYLNDALKPLTVEGKAATAAAAKDGTWPIARDLYLFTNGQPAGMVKTLIDFTLDPQKGQKFVEQVGYIPLSK